MLTQLETLKTRLAIPDIDVTEDDMLTFIIEALSARFDQETNRTLARTENATFEFDANDLEISVPCYPVESVTKFETKSSESDGWIEQPDVEFLIRKNCLISLSTPLNHQQSTLNPQLARLTYTGGYVLPGDPDPQPPTTGSQPVRLPADLEHACLEQSAFWYLRRDMLGLDAIWPSGGTMQRFSKLDLLLPVQTILKRHSRWSL